MRAKSGGRGKGKRGSRRVGRPANILGVDSRAADILADTDFSAGTTLNYDDICRFLGCSRSALDAIQRSAHPIPSFTLGRVHRSTPPLLRQWVVERMEIQRQRQAEKAGLRRAAR